MSLPCWKKYRWHLTVWRMKFKHLRPFPACPRPMIQLLPFPMLSPPAHPQARSAKTTYCSHRVHGKSLTKALATVTTDSREHICHVSPPLRGWGWWGVLGLRVRKSGFQLDHRENRTFPFWDFPQPRTNTEAQMVDKSMCCGFGTNHIV